MQSSRNSTFYLIEGNYQYQVEKNGYNSGKLRFIPKVASESITEGSEK